MTVPEIAKAPTVPLGEGMTVWRALPQRARRTVGAWCFADVFGPVDVTDGGGMAIDPHPHIGLQTVSWLVEGEIVHRDSLGSEQRIRPGQLNLMTAGRGIAHSERTPAGVGGQMLGAQLWVALPAAYREVEPAFAHHADLPMTSVGGFGVTVLVGELLDARSPARTFSPLVGAELVAAPGAQSELPVRPDFEYALVVLDGTVEAAGTVIEPGSLAYLGRGDETLALRSATPSTSLLLGGEPYGDELHMWWNFVGGTRTEIDDARADWEAHRRFGDVVGDDHSRIAAPSTPWSGRA